jgi:L-cysteine/cystine lyase
VTDAAAFRAEFPVLARKAYLNAGTEGPIPRRAAVAAQERIQFELDEGRCGMAYMESVTELADRLRSGYAAVLGAPSETVALTGSTTDGCNTVLAGLRFNRGDEILTTDEEHQGILAPLARAVQRDGLTVRVVPFDEIASEVRPSTRLIAASHVSYVSGRVIDSEALKTTGVPVLLDAAQALGAVPVDVNVLGCDYYAASGQKWMCGPEGSGCLYVKPERLDEVEVAWAWYGSLDDAYAPLTSPPKAGAARFDHGFWTGVRSAWALASMEVFAEAGWEWVHERAAILARRLADGLTERGLAVAPRGRSTLVSWHAEDAAAEVDRLAAHGIVVRSIPDANLIRASAGAWSSEEELDRLAELAAG